MSNSGPTDDVGTLRNELEQSRRLLESQADYSRRLRAEFYKNSPLTWRRSFPLALFAAIKAAQLINFARRPKGLRKPLWAAIAEIPEAIALGSENLRARSRRPAVALGLTWYDYDNWVRLFDTPTPTDLWRLGTAATGAEDCPEITIVIPAYESDEKYLSVALDSLRSQSYPHWRAIVVDDGSSNAVASAVLSKYAALDRRIAHFRREKNSGIAAATNNVCSIWRIMKYLTAKVNTPYAPRSTPGTVLSGQKWPAPRSTREEPFATRTNL